MEEIVVKLTDPVYLSAAAAFLSAFFAVLTFILSRRLSRRDRVDILKFEILKMVSTLKGRKEWKEVVDESYSDTENIGIKIDDLIVLFDTK